MEKKNANRLTLKYHVGDPGFAVVGIGENVVGDVEVGDERDVSRHRHHIRRRHRRQQSVRRRNHLLSVVMRKMVGRRRREGWVRDE